MRTIVYDAGLDLPLWDGGGLLAGLRFIAEQLYEKGTPPEKLRLVISVPGKGQIEYQGPILRQFTEGL